MSKHLTSLRMQAACLFRVQLHLPRIFGAALSGLIASGSGAIAGGFEEPIQSVFAQGASNAGAAAGGSLSTMFWNPSTITQSGQFSAELDGVAILSKVAQSGDATILPLGSPFGFTSPVSNSVLSALLPSGYVSTQVTDRLWAGISFNSPFGIAGRFSPDWAGAFYAQNTTLTTYNAAPTIAVKLADWISFGAGLQAQYADASLAFASAIIGPGSPMLAQVSGTGWAWGWTAGVTVTAGPTTRVGLGYRSALDQKIDATLNIAGGLSTPGSVTTTVKLPDKLNLGLRQDLTKQLTLLGTVEWTGWSRIGTSNLLQQGGLARGPNGAPIAIPFQYRDGWFYSIGLEYLANSIWTLRGGIAFVVSPITDQVRTPLVPDNQNTWYSAGATAHLTKSLSIDLAYTYVDFRSTPLNITPGNPSFNGFVTYVGTANSHFNILSIGLTYKFDHPAAPLIVKG